MPLGEPPASSTYDVDPALSSDTESRREASSSSDSRSDDATSPDHDNQPPSAQTVILQRGTHTTGPHDDDGIRESITPTQILAINQRQAVELLAKLGPN